MSLDDSIFLGIDIGTSSVKAGFVKQNGRGLVQTSAEYPTYYGEEGRVEQDAWDWWNAVTAAVQKLVEQAPQYALLVRGISVSSHSPALFGIDQKGEPVGRALIWMDRRAEGICNHELKDHEDYIHQYSLNRLDPYFMLPKMVWQKKYISEDYKRTDCYLQANGWIVYMLTGKCVTDVTNANLTQFMNVYTLNWDQGIFDRLDLDMGKMAPVVPSTRIAGTIRPDVARLWGIAPGAVVAAGCTDGSASPFGLGLSCEGDLFEMSGTSSGIGVILEQPRFVPNLCLMKHVRKNLWYLKGSTSCSGGSLKWFRDYVDQGRTDATFEEYSRLAQDAEPGAGGVLFLPYLNGERAPLWDSRLRGVSLGFGVSTGRRELVRSMMEGTAYALRTILEEFPEDIRFCRTILGTGGGYNSTVWSQIKADVMGYPIKVRKMEFDAAVLGSAYVAMEAMGISVPEPMEDLGAVRYEPNVQLKEVYDRQYKKFCRLYQVTRELFHEEDTYAGRD